MTSVSVCHVVCSQTRAFSTVGAEGGQPLAGTKESWVAPFAPYVYSGRRLAAPLDAGSPSRPGIGFVFAPPDRSILIQLSEVTRLASIPNWLCLAHFFGSRSSSAVTSGYACAIGWLLLPAAQPPKLTPYSSSARPPPSAIWPPPSAIRQSGGPRRTNGPTAGSRNPRQTKHHWDSLTTRHWQLATIFSPLATHRVKALTHRARPSASAARACFSHRNVKDHPHYPDILSLRQKYPSLASVSGTCSPFGLGSSPGNTCPMGWDFLNCLFPPCWGGLSPQTPFHGGNRHGLSGYFVYLGHAM